MSSKLIDIQRKFSMETKAAYERLVIQTLWDAHPLSFYHSACQEIIGLTKYAIRKYLLIDTEKESKINLTWNNDKDSNSDIIIKEIHVENGNNNEPLEIEVEERSESANVSEKWKIVISFQQDLSAEQLNYFKTLLTSFIQGLLQFRIDYEEWGDQDGRLNASQLLESELKDVINDLTKRINIIFERLTGDNIKSRIMFYYPDKQDQKGFLFYVDYSAVSQLDLESAITDVKKTDYFNELIHFYADKNMKDGTHREARVNSKNYFLSEPYDGINKYFEKFVANCSNFKDSISIKTLQSYLLEYPNKFLMMELFQEDACCKPPVKKGCQNKPLCYQIKGLGPSGLVAERGVTYVTQDLDGETWDFPDIITDKEPSDDVMAYALMHMIEMGIDISSSKETIKRGIVTPLYGKGQLIGVLFATKEVDQKAPKTKYFDPHQVELFESLAHKAGDILQELRDYVFYRKLVQTRSDLEQELLHEKIKEMAVRLEQDMKSREEKTVSINISFDTHEMQKKIAKKLADTMHKYMRLVVNVDNVEVKEFTHGTSWAQKVTLDIVDKSHLKLELPIVDPNQKTPEKYLGGYTISMIHEDPPEIVRIHKAKLELFFSYCWGIAGYVAPMKYTSEVSVNQSSEKKKDTKPQQASKSNIMGSSL